MEEVMREIWGVKEQENEKNQLKEEIKEGIGEQGMMIREEMEEMRREFGERKKKWKEEREELKSCIKELESLEGVKVNEGKRK